MTRTQGTRARVLELAKRPEGVHMTDFDVCTPTYIYGMCRKLAAEGLLIPATLHGKYTRYYANQSDADAARAKAQVDLMRAHSAERASVKPEPPALKAAMPAVKVAGFRKDAEVIFTERTKFTQCPGYQPRFEAMTPSFVRTALQSGRVTG